MHKILLIILGIVILSGAGWYMNRDRAMPEVEVLNFDRTGNLVKDNPGLKPNVWHLIYEEPGAPALTQELAFDDKSMCGSERCDLDAFQQGQQVSVRGILRADTVLVRSMINQ